MSEELKPCPFCGGKPVVWRKGIFCETCYAAIQSDDAENDWNRRAARDEEIARLKEALKRMAGNIAASSSIVPSDAIPLIEIARAALNGEKE